jgi:succinoglycan biosynthesis protein ExoV
MWSEFLPGCWGTNDDVWFSGIGTVIARHIMPAAHKWIVFSSGVGYGTPPQDFGHSGWEIVAVRGPLSASVLHLPENKAVVDGAMLIGSLPSFVPLPESERSGIVFMPHYEMLPAGYWPEVCRRAGIEYLSPLGDSKRIASRIRTAKLVLADAMHAAIVADSLRVPWVPLRSSDQINTFKWLDWTLSLRCPYEPLNVPFTSLLRAWVNKTLRAQGKYFTLPAHNEEVALKHYEANQKQAEQLWWDSYPKHLRRLVEVIPTRFYTSRYLMPITSQFDRKRVNLAAEALVSASRATSFLSADGILREKVNELRQGLKTIPSLVQKLRKQRT